MKKTKKSKINETRQDKVFNVINMIILWIVLILVAYPLIYVLSASFSNPQAVSSGKVWLWPVDFTLRGYEVVFQHPDIVRGFLNAIYIKLLLPLWRLIHYQEKPYMGKALLLCCLPLLCSLEEDLFQPLS